MARPTRASVNANNLKQTPIPVVGSRIQLTNSDGTITRTGQLLLEQLQQVSTTATIVGFAINDATTGTNVAPMLVSPADASVSTCQVVVKASDPSINLTFDILQNGGSVFSTKPVLPAGTTTGTVLTVGALTSATLRIDAGDVFSIDIIAGSTLWAFTAELEQ